MSARALILCAHPDDESLFAGARIVQMVRERIPVRVVALSDGVGSRRGGPRAVIRREEHFYAACEQLGADGRLTPAFSDQQSDTVPLVRINAIVERELADWQPTI